MRHNDDERLLEPERFDSVGDVVEACLAEAVDARGAPPLLAELIVDGTPVDEADLERLREITLDRVSEIEMRSRSAREVALASLESAESYLGNVSRSTSAVVAQLRTGRIEAAATLYASVLDALQIVIFTLAAAGRELGETGAALAGAENEVEPLVAELVDAQEARDWIRVADGLEHELIPLLADWSARTRDALAPPQDGD